ncbi:MAG: response regulator [Desulfobacterales bacterium]|nr:response regulator [Desulfobacterales bacterium]
MKEYNLNSLNIWVVDDETGICSGVNRALCDHKITFEDLKEVVGFNVKTFETGEDFLASLKNDLQPDIVLLDHKLPGISGIDILSQLKSKGEISFLPIMITAYGTFDYAVQATKLGAVDFIPKPFTPKEIRYAVQKASRDLILTRKNKQLEQENKKIRFEMISIVAHELKSPINAIESYLSIFKDKILGQDIIPYLPMVDRCVARISGMRKLIKDLTDLTKLESGARARTIESFDLVGLARQSLDGLITQIKSNGLTLDTKFADSLMVQADMTEVSMVINNLLTNAIKYNRPNGNIEIEIVRDNDNVIIRVTDTGIGMSKDEQQKLFKEFSRIKNEKTQDIEGTGLGLSILKKIALLYNGDVNVQSEKEQGSTFIVRLKI